MDQEERARILLAKLTPRRWKALEDIQDLDARLVALTKMHADTMEYVALKKTQQKYEGRR